MTTLALPVPYTPFVEHCESDEAEQAAELNTTLRKILDKTFRDYGHAVRSAYAKSHGLLQGKVTVLANLRPDLAQGLFAKPGTTQVGWSAPRLPSTARSRSHRSS
jgi:hypothetical protein